MKKILCFVAVCILLVTFSACSSNNAKQIGEIDDITKGYFVGLESESNVEINLDDYVAANGTTVTYAAESDNEDIATAYVQGSTLTATLKGAEGTAFITISVYSNGKKAFLLSFALTANKYEKVACIGDSLTYGHTWHNQSYPVYLQETLGDGVEVQNFGVNGSAVTDRNESNYKLKYDTLQEYRSSLAFEPDVVVIMLGSNDGYNWTGSEPTFEEEYAKLINSYVDNGAKQVVLLTSPPTMESNAFNISDEIIKTQVCPHQREIANQFGLPLVEIREAFDARDDVASLFRPGDGVHFSVEGAQFVAQLVADTLIRL